MEIVTGDVFNTKSDIIIHQVNCKGVMGSGIARTIRSRYPEVYQVYHDYCFKHNCNGIELLGKSLIVPTKNIIIANCFGQDSYGYYGQYTNYNALSCAFDEVYKYATSSSPKKTIAVPYGIGCGLGGGDWKVVSNLLEKYSRHYNIETTVFKLN